MGATQTLGYRSQGHTFFAQGLYGPTFVQLQMCSSLAFCRK
jgi:hypothetical protein